jgi:hypothetical protein
MPTVRLEVDGMDEVRAAFKAMGGAPMLKQLGQVHKRVGEIVIAKAGGAATGIGAGSGATIRPSASTRDVQLRVGGRFRANFGKWRQWGETQMFPPPEPRPYLVGAAIAAEDEILEAYVEGVNAVGGIKIERS